MQRRMDEVATDTMSGNFNFLRRSVGVTLVAAISIMAHVQTSCTCSRMGDWEDDPTDERVCHSYNTTDLTVGCLGGRLSTRAAAPILIRDRP